MAVMRYAVDGLNGDPNGTGVSAFEGDFSNAVVDIYDALDKANTVHQAENIHTVIIEVSGGPSGLTYTPTHNLVFTSAGTAYSSGSGFNPNGAAVGDYGIVGSKVAGHDGQVTIDASTITTYSPYNAVLASNRRGVLFERLEVINTPDSGPPVDAVLLSTANKSAVRDCILHQGSHAIWAKRTEDIEITGNFCIGGSGSNASCIKLEQDQLAQSTRGLIANNYIWKGGSSSGTSAHFAIQLNGAMDCEVYNNTIVDTVTDGIAIIANKLGEGSADNTVYNNIVVNSIDNGNSGAVGHDIVLDAASLAAGGNVIDYNTYSTNRYYLGGSFGPSAADGMSGGQVYTSLASWQTASSQDANSITDTPSFVGGTSPNSLEGVKLLKGSSQIGVGTDISWTTPSWTDFVFSKDVLGVEYGSPPNMGATAGELIRVNQTTGNNASADISVTPLKSLDYAMQLAGDRTTVQLEGTTAKNPYIGVLNTHSASTFNTDGGLGHILPNLNYSHGDSVPDLLGGLGNMQGWMSSTELYNPSNNSDTFVLTGANAKRAVASDVDDGTIPSGNTYCVELGKQTDTAGLNVRFTASPEETIKIRLRYQPTANGVRPRWQLTGNSGNQWDAVSYNSGTGSWISGGGISNNVLQDGDCEVVGGGQPQALGSVWEHIEFTLTLNTGDYDTTRYTFQIMCQSTGHKIWIDDLKVSFENNTTNTWENFSGNVWRLPVYPRFNSNNSLSSVKQVLKCSKSDWDANGVDALQHAERATDDSRPSGWGDTIMYPSSNRSLSACVNNTNSWYWYKDASVMASQASNGAGGTTCTKNSHGLFEGQRVQITDTTDYNGIYSVSNVTTNTFDIDVTFVSSGTGWFALMPDLYYHLDSGESINDLHIVVDDDNATVTVGHSGAELNNVAAYGGDINYLITEDCTVNTWKSRHGETFGVKIESSSPTMNDGDSKYIWFGDNIFCEGDGVSATSCTPTFNRCDLSYAGDEGIQSSLGARFTANNVIASYTSRVKTSGDGFNAEENTASVGSGMTLNHCIATNCAYDGIKAANTIDGTNTYLHGPIIIYNTISYNNNKGISGTATDLQAQTESQLTESHNLFGNTNVVGGVDTTTIIGEDPLFVDSSSDYRLGLGSPAIGTGLDSLVTTDIKSRLFDSPPSMGATSSKKSNHVLNSTTGSNLNTTSTSQKPLLSLAVADILSLNGDTLQYLGTPQTPCRTGVRSEWSGGELTVNGNNNVISGGRALTQGASYPSIPQQHLCDSDDDRVSLFNNASMSAEPRDLWGVNCIRVGWEGQSRATFGGFKPPAGTKMKLKVILYRSTGTQPIAFRFKEKQSNGYLDWDNPTSATWSAGGSWSDHRQKGDIATNQWVEVDTDWFTTPTTNTTNYTYEFTFGTENANDMFFVRDVYPVYESVWTEVDSGNNIWACPAAVLNVNNDVIISLVKATDNSSLGNYQTVPVATTYSELENISGEGMFYFSANNSGTGSSTNNNNIVYYRKLSSENMTDGSLFMEAFSDNSLFISDHDQTINNVKMFGTLYGQRTGGINGSGTPTGVVNNSDGYNVFPFRAMSSSNVTYNVCEAQGPYETTNAQHSDGFLIQNSATAVANRCWGHDLGDEAFQVNPSGVAGSPTLTCNSCVAGPRTAQDPDPQQNGACFDVENPDEIGTAILNINNCVAWKDSDSPAEIINVSAGDGSNLNSKCEIHIKNLAIVNDTTSAVDITYRNSVPATVTQTIAATVYGGLSANSGTGSGNTTLVTEFYTGSTLSSLGDDFRNHFLNGDPTSDIANGPDLIRTGVTSGVAFDFKGRSFPVGFPMDIGAYSFENANLMYAVTGMDLSNDLFFETLDQDKHQWWSADSDRYINSLPVIT